MGKRCVCVSVWGEHDRTEGGGEEQEEEEEEEEEEEFEVWRGGEVVLESNGWASSSKNIFLGGRESV